MAEKKGKAKRATEMNSENSGRKYGEFSGTLGGSLPPSVLGLLVRLRERLMGCESIER